MAPEEDHTHTQRGCFCRNELECRECGAHPELIVVSMPQKCHCRLLFRNSTTSEADSKFAATDSRKPSFQRSRLADR
jgi:hypothetical protein